MFDVTLLEFISAFKELALAVAGAVCFWIVWFGRSARRSDVARAEILRHQIIARLWPLFVVSLLGAFCLWGIAGQLLEASAHEGVTLYPTDAEISAVSPLVFLLFILLAITTVLLEKKKRKDPESFYADADKIFLLPLALLFVVISFPAWRGQLDGGQLFLFGHSIHTVFTLGTVVVLDYLLFYVKSAEGRRILYTFLFPISSVIWVGLGIDFASSVLIFNPAIHLTPRFYFMQTLIGILLINGAFLAGPVTERLISAVQGGALLSRRWSVAIAVSGAVSLVSWITVKFTDYFRNLSATYLEMLFGYFGVLFIAIITSLILRKQEFYGLIDSNDGK